MRHGARILHHLYVTKDEDTVMFQQFTQEETQLANLKKKKKGTFTNLQGNENKTPFLHSSQIICYLTS